MTVLDLVYDTRGWRQGAGSSLTRLDESFENVTSGQHLPR